MKTTVATVAIKRTFIAHPRAGARAHAGARDPCFAHNRTSRRSRRRGGRPLLAAARFCDLLRCLSHDLFTLFGSEAHERKPTCV